MKLPVSTLDIPSWIQLPEYDIAGNPRVWGDNIDMGAYEYGPWVKLPETPNSKFKIQNLKLLSVSPNPLSYGTYVKYELRVAGRVNISVFSTSGMKIKTLADFTGSIGDRGDIYWDCNDGNGHEAPDGSYIIRMTVDGKLVESVKIIKIR